MIAPGSIVVGQRSCMTLHEEWNFASDMWNDDSFMVEINGPFVVLANCRHPHAELHDDVGYLLSPHGAGWCTLELSAVQLNT